MVPPVGVPGWKAPGQPAPNPTGWKTHSGNVQQVLSIVIVHVIWLEV